jgi:hypothetical protein
LGADISVVWRQLVRTPVSVLWTFFRVAVTSVAVGCGVGGVTAWFMTTGLAREYQMSMAETGTVLGAVLGLVLGCVAYYAIFRGRLDFSALTTIVTITTLLSASSAFVLHVLTDTGGWLAMPIGVVTFLLVCIKTRTPLCNRSDRSI